MALKRHYRHQQWYTESIKQLELLSREEVKNIPGIGKKAMKEIDEAMQEHGLEYMTPDRWLLSRETPIDYGGFSRHIEMCLRSYVEPGDPEGYVPWKYIRTLGDLQDMTDKELLSISGIGKKALSDIRHVTDTVTVETYDEGDELLSGYRQSIARAAALVN